MKFPPTAFALILSAAAGFAATGAAMPPPPSIEDGSQAIPVGGCHSDIRTHYVPELERSARHFHRGADCIPVLAEEELRSDALPDDCHRGDDCRIREVLP